METAIVEGIRILSYVPKQGYQFLSVNLAMLDLVRISEIAKHLDFKLELVQIPVGSAVQIHALPWEGEIIDAPPDLGDRIEVLADLINPNAIRSALGGWPDVV